MCGACLPPRAGRTGPRALLGSVWMTEISRPLRPAEAVGALSLATDLAMGQPLYGKAGVSTRAGATLFALEHGLVRLD